MRAGQRRACGLWGGEQGSGRRYAQRSHRRQAQGSARRSAWQCPWESSLGNREGWLINGPVWGRITGQRYVHRLRMRKRAERLMVCWLRRGHIRCPVVTVRFWLMSCSRRGRHIRLRLISGGVVGSSGFLGIGIHIWAWEGLRSIPWNGGQLRVHASRRHRRHSRCWERSGERPHSHFTLRGQLRIHVSRGAWMSTVPLLGFGWPRQRLGDQVGWQRAV
mmetsp:Transcript_3962/g.10959  ORF Transcript_3962/g.10959 Transcript_3962/m.10959 type:complete len:219 (+) Transcript_3962:648-1304(+)